MKYKLTILLLLTLTPSLRADPWPTLTPTYQALAVTQLKTFSQDAQQKINTPLKLYESTFFLLYTDMGASEAKMWNILLTKMYTQMLQQFNLPAKSNIWRGKALVFIFQKREDFKKYETIIEEYPGAATALGVCHSLSRGDVRIAFFRQPETNRFATVLVHESTHGFLHRYLTPTPIPTWINEGLAEWMAVRLTPDKQWRQSRINDAREFLTVTHHTDQMTTQWKGTPAHYGIAYTLTDFMITKSRKGYVDLIRAIKNDKPWQTALNEDYKTTLPKLLHAYGQAFRVGPVKP